jgi:uncharacterized sporulation protein YeaH/YhbH (DUF444 family)
MNIIDRRQNSGGRSSDNRQRFLKRVEGQIKKALPTIINNNSVKEITSGKDRIKIPIKGINEPEFAFDRNSGNKKQVHPGNKEFSQGDRIKKPEKNGGRGGQGRPGSNSPETSEDEFTVSISKDEFMDYFFSDLELPDMVKKYLNTTVNWKQKRSGYSNQGTPNRLNIVASYKNSIARKTSSELFYNKKIKELEDKILQTTDQDEILLLEIELNKYKSLKLAINFMENNDLKYNYFDKVPVPTTSAVMFNIMDISGSMGFDEKDISKRFFLLLYMFLNKQYENIDIVYIRHHTEAKEVTEEEFFNSRETGGTVVYPALKLMNDIIDQRYNCDWNIYCAQASDGDVWNSTDAEQCYKILDEVLLKKIQYMVYIEIMRNQDGDLWGGYKSLANKNSNFAIGKISGVNQIWSVFRDFFKKI